VARNKAKSFRTYARSRRAADVVGGEFITYAKSDPHFPDAKTWGDLRIYLNGRGAAHEMVVAARIVWKDYRQQLEA
jgi:hypothetical protein